MVLNGSEADFDIQGNTLLVHGELGADDRAILQEQLAKLIEVADAGLVLDLSGIRYMGSGYMGVVSSAMCTARKKGRVFRIRAAKRVLRFLKMAGIDKLGTLESAGEKPGSTASGRTVG